MMDFPKPGSKVNDSIVIASVYYRELDDELIAEGYDSDMFTVLLLNPAPPYYTVMTISTKSTAPMAGWFVENRQDHMNIVPAVNGERALTTPEQPTGAWLVGYVDCGGEY